MTDWNKEQYVYISCVDEVRYSFVSHLSDALRREGRSVLVDSDDLLSKEAQEKVERARVSVIVLPGNRTVCPDKLLKVLNCQRNNDQVVIPVLYGVIPLNDGWFDKLDLRGLSPVHQSRTECSDSKLVEEIVISVNEKLLHMGRIGIDSKLVEVENMVNKQSLGIRCVGIWGMPGIGKTTLARAVFDQVSGGFDACCFIEDDDKAIDENKLYRILVEQLMKDQPGNSGTITKLRLRRDKLNNKRVLVVLDDVRNPVVAESFLEGFDWFGPESLIVITSRDKQVFRLCRINQIYEVQGLNEEEALKLFMLCASVKDMGEPNLQELLMKVLEHANGNPLALSIYGRELKGKKRPPEMEMETAFLELKRRPPSEIVDVVKNSYDTLSDSEKNIFLDVACFFQGENVDYVMQLLEGCGFFPHVGIDVLVEKCLVTISENRVRMHNLIQDVGREIIKGETVQIERRSRLWEPQRIKFLLEDNEHEANGGHTTTFKCAQGTEEIEGMFLDTSNLSFDIKPAAFVNMLNLRLLKIYCSSPEIHPGINFSEGFLHSLPNELRLLHWENYPLQILPQNFDPVHLVEINMPYSQLQKLWDESKNLEMLRTIMLCHSQQLVDIGDLLNAPNLEVIDLQGCTRLQSFPATDQLLHLRVVNLSGCTKIKSFPKIPPNTETLHLQGTGITELPLSIVKPNYIELLNLLNDIPGLSGVSNLKQNDLERLTSLVKMSSSSQDLGKLICLDLKDCSRLRSLPNMVSLEFLKVLDLSGCSELETILGFPRNLKELYIAGTAVREVPQLPQSLELLNAHGCISLKSIPFNSENLHMHYIFSNCFNLSPQVVNDFLVKVLGNIKPIPRELLQELNETPAFSFCAPSHANQDSTLDLQLGSSVMTRLNPSWRNTLVGFAMLVEVSFSEDYSDATGIGISCVCRWKNKEGHSHKIERNLHCRAAGKAAPRVQKDHIFVFCDVKMRPCTDEGNYPDMWADLVVFEFFPVKQQTKRLDDSCTVTRCGVYAITGNTDLKMSSPVLKKKKRKKMSSPVLSLDPMEVSGNEVEEVLRVRYYGLEEMDKALFLYIACLFNDEDADLVAPLIASIDLDVSLGLNVLANSSLIRVSSNGEIVMHCLLRNMGKEILHRESVFPGSSKDLTRDFEKDSVASFSSRNWEYDVYLSFRGVDVRRDFLSHLIVTLEDRLITTFKDSKIERDQTISHRVQAIRESKIVIVMFSKNYASSSWLLDELVEIAQRYEEVNQRVITIYYDVDPLDVRNQRGEFGRQFEQTCKNKTKDKIQRWCRALTNMANLDGLVSKTCESDGKFIELIVEEVKRLVDKIPMEGNAYQEARKKLNSYENLENWTLGSPTNGISTQALRLRMEVHKQLHEQKKMVAISMYRGNLHKVPDVPRRWVMPERNLSFKNFKSLLHRRKRALSRISLNSNPNLSLNVKTELVTDQEDAIPSERPGSSRKQKLVEVKREEIGVNRVRGDENDRFDGFEGARAGGSDGGDLPGRVTELQSNKETENVPHEDAANEKAEAKETAEEVPSEIEKKQREVEEMMKCKFHHPRDRQAPPPDCLVSPIGLPLRPGEPLCVFYTRYGICKFGPSCKFDHPMRVFTYENTASEIDEVVETSSGNPRSDMIPDTKTLEAAEDDALLIPEGAITRSKARKLAETVRNLLGDIRIKEDQLTHPILTSLSSNSS